MGQTRRPTDEDDPLTTLRLNYQAIEQGPSERQVLVLDYLANNHPATVQQIAERCYCTTGEPNNRQIGQARRAIRHLERIGLVQKYGDDRWEANRAGSQVAADWAQNFTL